MDLGSRLPAGLLDLDDAPFEVRRLIAGALGAAHHDLGDELVTEGAVPDTVHIVVRGRARASARGHDGAEVQLGLLGPGALIAPEAAAREPSPVSVRATGPLQTLTLHGTIARSLTKLWPPTGAAFRDATIAPPPERRRRRRHARLPDPPASDPVGAAPPAAETASSDDWAPFRSRKRPRVPQVFALDQMDCGAAALAAICRAFGHPVSLVAVREAVSSASDGTSLLGLHHGAQALGLTSAMTTVSPSRLDELPLPALCHVDGNHWVVLDKVDRKQVRVMDPVGSSGSLSRSAFEERFTGFALLTAPTEKLAEAPVASSGGPFFRPFLRAEWPAITIATLCGIGIAASTLAVPLSSKWVIEKVIQRDDTASLLPVMLIVLGVLGLAAGLTVVQRYVITRAALRIDRASLDRVAETLLALPVTFFANRRTGDIERRLNGLREVRSFFLTRGVGAFVALFQVVGAWAIMAHWDVRLPAVYLVVVPFYLVLMYISRRKLRPAFQSLEESWGRYKSRQIDAIRGIDTVKATGAEPQLQRRLAGQFDDLAGRLFSADFTIMLYEGALAVVALVPLALAISYGSYQVVEGTIPISEYVPFLSLVMLTSAPLTQLLSLWDVFQQGRVLLDRLGEFVDHRPEQVGEGIAPAPGDGRVRFDRVGFRHPGATGRRVLDDITLQAGPGETVAIVGRSGAGKSTLLLLLAALLQPESGTITCDGVDLAGIDLRAHRRRLGIVLQDSHLFDGTIAENIAVGADEVDPERLARAARAATADDFVRRLPLGYQTRVGERGTRLSGGERQRICVARALYRDPTILLLDEATSALDAESEAALQASLRAAAADRTVFVVAHRLSTVRDADQILVLDAGRVAERGTHAELLERRGLYFELAADQVG
ncbi:ATP-binding cassette domain-containing protein [Nocardioides marmoriginsengisoli]|uniref:ATP-binding cassette domain-containing protein n=1 Tax=Nocardioides marmoriginsengisoli TaxID=661483 RepID=A0A3N0CI82_9ACTN|nr:peptidase domain-containing ABC transporter [Nocardioides marmoriginsengisoli]RNL63187.1 ATP-binding cassette domain-containing protein [Nocardioides marmoriginsengisoli]